MEICPLFQLMCTSGRKYHLKNSVDISLSQFYQKYYYISFDVSSGVNVRFVHRVR